MELLRLHLAKVRIPEPRNLIYKKECCLSSDTPRSERGLYVDMCSFLGFGMDFVKLNFKETGNPVYLHIQQRRKPVPEERPLKKPMILTLEYETTYNIVILPDFISLPFPSVELPEKVRLAAYGIIMAKGAEKHRFAPLKTEISKYALTLQQLDNGVVVPSFGWKCSKCDKTDNLWMNLTDGMILCGRKQWDGSGGNNHSIEHYKQTKYPLVVKLGTITADLKSAGNFYGSLDVYSYPEDDSVEDPMLAQHLSHFNIDFSSLQKTEMTTEERWMHDLYLWNPFHLKV